MQWRMNRFPAKTCAYRNIADQSDVHAILHQISENGYCILIFAGELFVVSYIIPLFYLQFTSLKIEGCIAASGNLFYPSKNVSSQ